MRGFVEGLVIGLAVVGVVLMVQVHDGHRVTSIPSGEVYVLCQPTSHETSPQYAACVLVVTEAWEMGQR